MKMVEIAGSGLTVSRLVFGTASLWKVGAIARRRTLLETAVAAGFTHFDTAPYYGFGTAERDLASVLKAHPDVTITTKVGLYSPGGDDQSYLSVVARKTAGKAIRALATPAVNFAVSRARASLEGSLRRVGRDCIDLYLMHEPEAHLVDFDEWRRWQEAAVSEGKVRSWGAAGETHRLGAILDAGLNPGPVLQVSDSLAAKEADVLAAHGRQFQLTFGYLSSASKVGPFLPAEQVLALALQRNSAGAVLVSTTKSHRVTELAEIARKAKA